MAHTKMHSRTFTLIDLPIILIYFTFSARIHARSVKKVSQYVLEDGHEYVYDTYTIRTAGTMDVKTHSAGEAFQYKTRIQKKGKTFNVEVSNNIRSSLIFSNS